MKILTRSGSSRPQDGKPPGLEEDPRQKSTREDGPIDASPAAAFNSDSVSMKAKEDLDSDVVDPLAGMPDADKWGIKGLQTLMHNYPDYHAMVVGMDPNSMGLDMSSPE